MVVVDRNLVVVAICALPVLAAAGFVSCAAIDREDGFYLADAEPLDPDDLLVLDADSQKSSFDRERFGFAVHRLQGGRGVVLGYRFYSNGNLLAVDDERYRGLTVWLPSGAPQSTEELLPATACPRRMERSRAVVRRFAPRARRCGTRSPSVQPDVSTMTSATVLSNPRSQRTPLRRWTAKSQWR